MPQECFNWLGENYVEVVGAFLGLIYIFLSIRQNIFTWPVGLLTSVIYIYVFFVAKFYADMALQVYYVGVSAYGWYYWMKGNPQRDNGLPVSGMPPKFWLPLSGITLVLFLSITFVLKNYTDSPIPVWDSLTTALSLAATWMLARKYIENWLIWIFVDFLSAVLYAVKNLWPTVILFVVYTVMAVVGYYKWKRETLNTHEQNYSYNRP